MDYPINDCAGDSCKCSLEGELFSSGERRIERCGFCTCENGDWTCEIEGNCAAATCGENEEYVTCLTSCPKICANGNNYAGCTANNGDCTSGCQCQSDKVLHNGQCIPISSCPCYHGGVTYKPGDKVEQTECRKCICEDEGWSCYDVEFCYW
ncbi:Hemocytin [Holothuria leucospilota]|uniref:Hemocytin n=1 Tax=Holothuria leucospilota TaxID=206669 RepID=A0A9Q0YPS2_HOLLE|nr:Hemocytin [Holothuria leucospilota]